MRIYFNDQITEITASLSLHELLIEKNQLKAHFAVALNNQFIPRMAYNTTALKADDRIDIIVPMQGG